MPSAAATSRFEAPRRISSVTWCSRFVNEFRRLAPFRSRRTCALVPNQQAHRFAGPTRQTQAIESAGCFARAGCGSFGFAAAREKMRSGEVVVCVDIRAVRSRKRPQRVDCDPRVGRIGMLGRAGQELDGRRCEVGEQQRSARHRRHLNDAEAAREQARGGGGDGQRPIVGEHGGIDDPERRPCGQRRRIERCDRKFDAERRE